jgi:hypothetical protein
MNITLNLRAQFLQKLQNTLNCNTTIAERHEGHVPAQHGVAFNFETNQWDVLGAAYDRRRRKGVQPCQHYRTGADIIYEAKDTARQILKDWQAVLGLLYFTVAKIPGAVLQYYLHNIHRDLSLLCQVACFIFLLLLPIPCGIWKVITAIIETALERFAPGEGFSVIFKLVRRLLKKIAQTIRQLHIRARLRQCIRFAFFPFGLGIAIGRSLCRLFFKIAFVEYVDLGTRARIIIGLLQLVLLVAEVNSLTEDPEWHSWNLQTNIACVYSCNTIGSAGLSMATRK